MVQWFNDLKLSTKTWLAIVSTFAVIWATPMTHDLIVQIIGPHPKITALLSLIAGIWAVLHNPISPAIAAKQAAAKQ